MKNKHHPVNAPAHYTRSAIEPIRVIEAWGLGFHLGNAVKYIARAGHKGSELEDLEKARWYIDRAIEQLNAHGTPTHESQGVLMRCLFCHAQLPLGPANDRGVPAVELRLAESLAFQNASIPGESKFADMVISYWVDQDAVDRAALAERARRSRRSRRG